MELLEFLDQKKIKLEHFAVLIGYAGAYVKRVARGYKKPSKQIISCIEHFTGNEVTEKDLLNTYYNKQI